MNTHDRFDNLDRHIEHGTLLRRAWGDGKERACLLAALAPEAINAPDKCPADVIPQWLAHLTPEMDDSGTEAVWPVFVRRYASVVRRGAETLDAAGWRRAEYRVRAACVREAMQHTQDERALAVCRDVISLCERVVAGDEPGADEWVAVRVAASAAARAAAWDAARAAARVAASAAASATARATARDAAWVAARDAAWDRINDAVLDAIETECGDR